MPNMSETYYSKYNKKLAVIQKGIALQLMLEAGAEERRLALEANDVTQGVPCVTVVTDAHGLNAATAQILIHFL
ncbi:hypothetical protein B5X24_HaOG215089, partial [Helicoverpa armigera]